MRLPIYCLLLLLSFQVSAQSKSTKQWLEAEAKFHRYFAFQDYEKATEYCKKAENIARSKFKFKDSLYAATVLMKAELALVQMQYQRVRQTIEEVLPQLRAECKKGTKLNFRHYNFLLLYGNASYFIADSYMFERELVDGPEKLPKDPASRFKKALSEFDTAIAAYKELKTLHPEHPDANQNIAACYRQKGRLYGQFLNDLESCITQLNLSVEYAEDLEAYRLLGVANGIAGRHFIAIEHFKKALEVGGEQPSILYALEVAYRQLADIHRDSPDAKKYAEKADSYHIQWKAIDPNFNPNGN